MTVFVMTNVTAAVMSFRMIALIPHHLPRLIGFSGGGRVDMNEFAQLAAYQGAREAVDKRGRAPEACCQQGRSTPV